MKPMLASKPNPSAGAIAYVADLTLHLAIDYTTHRDRIVSVQGVRYLRWLYLIVLEDCAAINMLCASLP